MRCSEVYRSFTHPCRDRHCLMRTPSKNPRSCAEVILCVGRHPADRVTAPSSATSCIGLTWRVAPARNTCTADSGESVVK